MVELEDDRIGFTAVGTRMGAQVVPDFDAVEFYELTVPGMYLSVVTLLVALVVVAVALAASPLISVTRGRTPVELRERLPRATGRTNFAVRRKFGTQVSSSAGLRAKSTSSEPPLVGEY
jgi:hypothetical protein